jgi:hypothetical protein
VTSTGNRSAPLGIRQGPQQLARAGQAFGDRVVVAGMEQAHGVACHQLGGRGQRLRRHPFQDLRQRGPVGRDNLRCRVGHDESTDVRPVPGGHRVSEGVEDRVLRDIPTRGPPVQLRHHRGRFPEQPVPERVAQERVVAEPARFRAEPDDEIIDPFQLLQRPLALGPQGDGVGEFAAHLLADARLEKEPTHVRGMAGKDLVGQVVVHGPQVTGEVSDPRPVPPGKEAHREMQADGPTLGAVQQRRHLVAGDVQAVVGQQLGGLLRGEREIGRPDLGEVSRGP